MKSRYFLFVLVLIIAGAAAVSILPFRAPDSTSSSAPAALPERSAAADSAPQDSSSDSPKIEPLAEGASIPAEITVRTADGSAVNLAELVGSAPSVVIFYRGGW